MIAFVELLHALKEDLLPFIGTLIADRSKLYTIWRIQEANNRQHGFFAIDINIIEGSAINEFSDTQLVGFQLIQFPEHLVIQTGAPCGKYEDHFDYNDPHLIENIHAHMRAIVVLSIGWNYG